MRAVIAWIGFGLCVCGLPAQADGPVSDCSEEVLWEAIQDGWYITFPSDCTTTLSSPAVITNTVILDASGHSVTISAGGGDSTHRLFTVEAGGSLTLIGLKLTGGKDIKGGAIFVNPGAELIVSNCTFVGNSAVGTNGAPGKAGLSLPGTGGFGRSGEDGEAAAGGAIFNRGALTVLASRFFTNSASGGSGGAGGNGGNGGAIGGVGGRGGDGATGFGGAIYNTGTLLVRDTSFTGNTAQGGSGAAAGHSGSGPFPQPDAAGGVGAEGSGGAIWSDSGTEATVIASTFSSNSGTGGSTAGAGSRDISNGATGRPGGVAAGGAVCAHGQLIATNCTFYSNQVKGGKGGDGGNGSVIAGNGGDGGNGSGGGVWVNSGAWLVNCTLSSSSAYGGTNGAAGGGPFLGRAGRPGKALGGNVANADGTLRLINTILDGNPPGGNGSGSTSGSRNNVSSDSSISLGESSLSKTDPKLGTLANNGGNTLTFSLKPTSPAVDAGDTASGPAIDQRGMKRPIGFASDAGAFELVYTNNLTIFQKTNGTIVLSVSSLPLKPVSLEASEDLSTWTSIYTNAAPYRYIDPAMENYPMRWYRIGK